MIKKILIAFLVLFLVLTVVGFFLPTDYRVERSSTMPFTPTQILAITADLPTWEHWTSWNKDVDPDCVWTFTDATTFHFDGPINGEGSVTVTSSSLDGMTWDLAFSEGKHLAKGGLIFRPGAEGTEVVWFTVGVVKGIRPIGGWLGITMDRAIGHYFEDNLIGLEAALVAKG